VDTPLDWSRREDDLMDSATLTAKNGGKVGFAIDTFDPARMAEIKGWLEHYNDAGK